MHDHTYRMGIAWQNTAYNQPPHLGYYLPDYIDGKLTNNLPAIAVQTHNHNEFFSLQGRKRVQPEARDSTSSAKNGRTKKVFVK